MALVALLAGPSLAQSPTLQRLEQLEHQERQARMEEAAQWRTFPRPPSRSDTEPHDGSGTVRDAYNPLAPDSWLNQQLGQGNPNACQYHWSAWTLDPHTGIRSTAMRCSRSLHQDVAVQCSSLQLTTTFAPRQRLRWSNWRLPATQGEREMVAALCDNLTSEEKRPSGPAVR